MRRTLLVGVVLALAAALVVVLSDMFDLELGSVTLLGVALGAVVALVPDRSPLMRLAGFAAGFVITWVSYIIRAGFLPDTATGRGVTVGLVILLCVAVAALSFGRVPLWSTLVGAAAMAGAFEYTYSAEPPDVLATSTSTATSLLLTVAIGYLLVSLLAPREEIAAEAAERPREPRQPRRAGEDENHTLDEMMEKSQ